jgi:hypothetical protein
MLLRLTPETWAKLGALLAVLNWKRDFQVLSQLPSIRIIDGLQYCSVADDLLIRLNSFRDSMSWFSPGSDMSWFPELLNTIPALREGIPAPAPVPDLDPDLNLDPEPEPYDPELHKTAKDVLGPSDYHKLHNPLNCDRPKGW